MVVDLPVGEHDLAALGIKRVVGEKLVPCSYGLVVLLSGQQIDALLKFSVDYPLLPVSPLRSVGELLYIPVPRFYRSGVILLRKANLPDFISGRHSQSP